MVFVILCYMNKAMLICWVRNDISSVALCELWKVSWMSQSQTKFRTAVFENLFSLNHHFGKVKVFINQSMGWRKNQNQTFPFCTCVKVKMFSKPKGCRITKRKKRNRDRGQLSSVHLLSFLSRHKTRTSFFCTKMRQWNGLITDDTEHRVPGPST